MGVAVGLGFGKEGVSICECGKGCSEAVVLSEGRTCAWAVWCAQRRHAGGMHPA